MSRMPYEENEGREGISKEEQEWAVELADLIDEVHQAKLYAKIAPQAYLADVPEESKAIVYEKAMQILAYRAEQEYETQSEAIH